ncbi:cytochrome P450 [Streptomyces sp. 7R007]
MDGADHARLRRTTAKSFTSHRIAALEPLVQELTDTLLDRMAAAPQPADFISEFAEHLPLTVLCGLLGVPKEDSERFGGWVEVLFDIEADPETQYLRRLELVRYMGKLLDAKARSPQDDLLSSLIGEHHRGEMSRSEMLTMGLTLLMAGFQSTIGQLGLTVLSVLSDPEVSWELSAEPDLLPFAVEETMRLNPASLISFPRVALESVALGEVTVRAGEAVVVSFLHANRDEKVFHKPEHLVLEDRSPGHIAFGHGPHRCLGAPLATLQLRVTLARLFERFPTLRLADVPEPVVWKEGLATRGLSRLLVTWETERSDDEAEPAADVAPAAGAVR